MKKEIVQIDSQEFQARVLEANSSVLVFFGASYCAGCKALTPSMEGLAEDYADKVEVFKIDIEEVGPKIPTQYGIRGLPTIIAFRNGEEVGRVMGMVPAKVLKTLAENSLKE